MKALHFWSITTLLLLFGVTACSGTAEPSTQTEIKGPAMILFYTDN